MSREELENMIIAKFRENGKDCQEEDITKISYLYARNNGSAENIDGSMIENLLKEYKMPKHVENEKNADGIRRSGSKKITLYNLNPSGEFLTHPKTELTTKFLIEAIENSFLSTFLNLRQIKNVVKALKPFTVNPNTVIIKQNDIGDRMYVVEEGSFDIIKNNLVIDVRKRGSVFGEIALLHNIKRTATVRSIELSKIWALDIKDYTAIKETDDLNSYNLLKKVLKENVLFNAEEYKSAEEIKTYIREGGFIKENYYFIATQPIKVKINDEILCFNEGHVLTNGIAVSDLEGFYIPKMNN